MNSPENKKPAGTSQPECVPADAAGGKSVGAALSRAASATGGGVKEILGNVWQGLSTNVFALIALIVTVTTAIAAPIIVGRAKHEWEYSERAAIEAKLFMEQIAKPSTLTDGDVERLHLINALYEGTGNENKLELRTDKFKVALEEVTKRLVEQRKSAESIAEMTRKAQENESAKEDAVKQAATKEAALRDAEAKRAAVEKERDDLNARIATMAPGESLDHAKKQLVELDAEKARLSGQLAKLQGELDTSANEIKRLKEIIFVMTPKTDSGNGPPSLAPEERDKQMSALLVENKKQAARINDLLKFITEAGKGYWVYIGYKDEAGRLQNSHLKEIGATAYPQPNKEYTLNTACNIRELPSKDFIATSSAAVLSEGYKIVFSHIREPFPYKEKGRSISPVWGQVQKAQEPANSFWSRLWR